MCCDAAHRRLTVKFCPELFCPMVKPANSRVCLFCLNSSKREYFKAEHCTMRNKFQFCVTANVPYLLRIILHESIFFLSKKMLNMLNILIYLKCYSFSFLSPLCIYTENLPSFVLKTNIGILGHLVICMPQAGHSVWHTTSAPI